jgi:hypothetical protein
MRRRMLVTVLAVLLGLAGLSAQAPARRAPTSPASPTASTQASAVALGERLYREGLGTTGSPIPATVQEDLQVPATTIPCINCHRRSGWGTTEGKLTTPPIVGPMLFAPVTLGIPQIGLRTTGPGTRPAYDAASLARAVKSGVGADGRALSPTMPRYSLSAADAAALVAYLRTLGAEPPAGVTDSTIHFATITTPTGDPRKRAAVLAVLRAFTDMKNAGTRNETRRRTNGPWDMKAHYDLYRQWDLHEWSLQGPPDTWARQLTEHYASQPVFAVVSGVADGDWSPVHDFCEREHVPCIFPQAVAPPDRGVDGGFYSLYFSQGATLEAAALGEYLLQAPSAAASTAVLQVTRCGGPGQRSADQFGAVVGKGLRVTARCLPPGPPLTAEAWRELLAEPADILVPWLEAADLAGLQALAARGSTALRVRQVFLSATLLGDQLGWSSNAVPLRDRAFLIDPYVTPDEFDEHTSRSLSWLKSRSIDAPDRIAAVNAFYSVGAVSDALSTPRAITSREYFVEQIEHMVGRSPQRSAYPSMSLAPLRRFASFGCAILKVPAVQGDTFSPVAPWFVPKVQ